MKHSLGELEQKIMNIIWQSKGALKPADVLEKLNGDYAYTTVMTLLSRLYDKGFLKRRLKGKAYFYSAAKSKDEFGKNMLSRLYKTLFEDYGDIALVQFMDSVKDNPEDLRKLKKFLQENE